MAHGIVNLPISIVMAFAHGGVTHIEVMKVAERVEYYEGIKKQEDTCELMRWELENGVESLDYGMCFV